eukprot:EC691407.1.p1 GENE.EC691407.1~~EC691407.1.p1  ORF type:complete len:185 (+),score=39.03 EC691407.1:45-599(+)
MTTTMDEAAWRKRMAEDDPRWEDDEEEDDTETDMARRRKRRHVAAGPTAPPGVPQEEVRCPYLDTINRALLDFDFEKLCSVTLANSNVYVCLVCGKYFQGRGKGTPAYFHALESSHYVFMNLHNGKFFCIPENYKIKDSSLQDIAYNWNPLYSREQIANMDGITRKKRGVEEKTSFRERSASTL